MGRERKMWSVPRPDVNLNGATAVAHAMITGT